MTVLGIETSCDETSAAVVRGRRILSNVVYSQVERHAKFAGVVPELASRMHMEHLPRVVEAALRKAFGRDAGLKDLGRRIDAVAYTQGPGLMGALLIGKVAAQSIAEAHGLPLVGVNHLEGHALAMGLVSDIRYPFISLIVSGGHTELVLVRAAGRYRVLGRTRDDAAGEVFDKVAKLLRLGYPGGPAVDRRACEGDPAAVDFPRPLLPGTWDFSFSGLKTAVLYYVRDAGYLDKGPVRPAIPAARRLPRKFVSDICASFQDAVVDTLVDKTCRAARHTRCRSVVVGGGVAANSRLREKFQEKAASQGLRVHFPPRDLCTDNAAMIAYTAGQRLRYGRPSRRTAVEPSMRIRSWRQ